MSRRLFEERECHTCRKRKIRASLYAAFPRTIPILAGFLFLGIAYGIYMSGLGFSPFYPMVMSVAIFAGSMEFVAGNMLLGSFEPLQAFLLTLMVNARHLFYGLSMLEKFRDKGRLRPYLIFGMCDETFSINYTLRDLPKEADEGYVMLFVTILNQLYWFAGATIGAWFGSSLTFSTKGIEFVMTAMFIVIFMEQWMKEKEHRFSIAGLVISAACLVIFGKNGFIIPSMLAIFGTLLIRGRFDREGKR